MILGKGSEREEIRAHLEQEQAVTEEKKQNEALRNALKASENKGKTTEEVHKIYMHIHAH